MFLLVGRQDVPNIGTAYAIMDTEDNDITIVSESDLCLCLRSGFGVHIGGASLINGVLNYTDEYFPQENNEEDDDLSLSNEDDYIDDEDLNTDEYLDYDDDYDEDIDSDEEILPLDDSDYEDDGYLYDDEEGSVEESTVSKLYKCLNEEQIKMLKRYYLWYSNRIFKEGVKDPTLGMKDKNALKRKQADLNSLRNTGGLWHYAGFIDMGYRGAGSCTLGHPLRYMHLAWDVEVSDIETAFFGEDYSDSFEKAISSSNCIIFGIKCISDFFEVNKDCVRALQAAQRDSLKDMSLMYEHYNSNTVDEVLAKFKVMDEIMAKVSYHDVRMKMITKDEDKFILPFALSQFYMQFRKVNMIPPKSLVQEIRDKMVGWLGHKFTPDLKPARFSVLLPKVEKILGKASSPLVRKIEEHDNCRGWSFYSNLINTYRTYLNNFFVYEICGHYKYNADTNKDEGGRSKGAKYQLYRTYKDAENILLQESIEYTLEYLTKLTNALTALIPIFDITSTFATGYVTRSDDKYTISDSKEYNESHIGVYSKDCNSELYKSIVNLKRLISNSRVYTFDPEAKKQITSGIDGVSDFISSAVSVLNNEKDTYLAWVEKYLQKMCDEKNSELERERQEENLKLSKSSNTYSEESSSDKKSRGSSKSVTLTQKEVMNFLFTCDLSKVKGQSFAIQVYDTIKNSGKEPTSKQYYYMKMLYKAITGVSVIDANEVSSVSLDSRSDIEEAIRYVFEHRDLVDNLTYDICKSIFKYGKISEKQMKYAEKALNVYNDHKGGII